VKQRELIHRIAAAAEAAGVEFVQVREGASHTLYRCGGQQVVIPRHREVRPGTAETIMRKLDPLFGKGWWRR
jgi:predicted RNA binding protein YcfA (HicA-like mRNA interferase family)